ncbi:sigma-70 family RNA polymerase sigma factor [Phragmitibacter flavus]|uniref:Sigma-70 family RNA polymerase sigma factor n=1 Tax=Phragmitibacter flavus TaxID=2576071 RepID=A0A5R8KDP5_9BACT|nr:sigma-70 family RNA polymerase sigma factor [Phragmitibacter flavus]TLD69709.1 sigma-70 family RNA polymerase sigma factor [Phragmitibacter flavus]
MPSQPSKHPAGELVQEALAQHESNLIAYACGILGGDEERARDVVQDTLLKLHLADPDRVRENLKAWLYAVCRNRAFDVLRKEHRIRFTDDDDHLDWLDEWQPDPSEDASRDEMLEHVWAALEQLPQNQREVIRLKFQHGLSYKEISTVTSLSVTNVGFLLHTAIKRLRKLMNHACAE